VRPGIIDAFNPVNFAADQELVDYAGKWLAWWEKSRMEASACAGFTAISIPATSGSRIPISQYQTGLSGSGGTRQMICHASALTISTMQSRRGVLLKGLLQTCSGSFWIAILRRLMIRVSLRLPNPFSRSGWERLPGVTALYEALENPEVMVASDVLSPQEAALRIMAYIRSRWLG
jgi:hypothetical protein